MTSGGRLEVAWLAPYARIRLLASTVVLAALTAGASLAQAFDPERTFTPGAFAFSLGGGGGEQVSFSARSRETLDLWWVDGRASWVPFGTVGRDGPLYGALEVGIEPIYQQYFGRASGYWAGSAWPRAIISSRSAVSSPTSRWARRRAARACV
jgi:hypothetical protein